MIEISTAKVKELRELSGAGVMECKKALLEAEGDLEKALKCLKQRGFIKAEKKAERKVEQGLIEAYIHAGGRIGVMVELNCETDFAAHTNEFKELAHNLALQVAALSPQYVTREEIPQGAEVQPQEVCLLLQPFIKEPERTIQDIINDTIAKIGENIKIKRFVRYELGG
jgi:elongation factor Ts